MGRHRAGGARAFLGRRLSRYVPDRGDILWIDLSPQAGHEQAGRRPALVITPKSYNVLRKLMIACPITSKTKRWDFDVVLTGTKTAGVVLSDQLQSLDWVARKVTFREFAPEHVMDEVLARVAALLGF